ncbi:aldose epimerase family protein [Bacillus sp. PS06]|uniref:aldose epimerase family protein n=1 Tax=Bacillus sp. PS06 TaxID=2764176 RepID=UPI00177AC638|nr:aldose epimerase family protein [Bacillus sp. PS06]MBD8067733.1 galactose mutarotase [Bacillus sp. PS06]
MEVSSKVYGEFNGQTVFEYSLKNNNGMEITCINFGCVITSIRTPDKDGVIENVVLSYNTFEEYKKNLPYFGAVCGRVAGRINGAEFELEGKKYTLAKNNGENHLHGGEQGYSHVLWESAVFESAEEVGVEFFYTSPDKEEGYPGNLTLKVVYTLTNKNELLISYHGQSDETTLVNLTNHTYFNLSGNSKRSIADHVLTMKSDQLIELRDDLIPTGQLIDVGDTPFDFRQGRKIKDGIDSTHPQNVLVGHGYDHPLLLSSNHDKEIVLEDEKSGRRLTVETDEPCVVLYTGNFLEDNYKLTGVSSTNHYGLCLETQGPPDSIHQPEFASCVLEKGKEYRTQTKFTFSV